MRASIASSFWIVAFLSVLFLLMMVFQCGALGCSWERAKDARGLSRHRASCHLYKRYSVLATQKRRERAKEASHHDAVSSPTKQSAVFLNEVDFRESVVSDKPPLFDHQQGLASAL
jgi:hypothetical protein